MSCSLDPATAKTLTLPTIPQRPNRALPEEFFTFSPDFKKIGSLVDETSRAHNLILSPADKEQLINDIVFHVKEVFDSFFQQLKSLSSLSPPEKLRIMRYFFPSSTTMTKVEVAGTLLTDHGIEGSITSKSSIIQNPKTGSSHEVRCCFYQRFLPASKIKEYLGR